MNDRFIGRILFFAVLTIGIIRVPAIGPAWDEPDNIVAGGQYANFFQKRLDGHILTQRDQDASIFGRVVYTQEPAIARYPPVPNYLGTLVALVTNAKSSAQIIVAFHVATVLFFALLVTYVFLFGRLLGLSQATSIFAALVTFLYPTLFGHGLSNIKDTAQVSLFTASLYYLVKKQIIIGAVFWGLALASKFNAVYVPIIWTGWMLVSNNKVRITTYRLLITIATGLATAFVVWPYLWFDPIARGMEIVHYFTTVGQGYKIFWDGTPYQVGVGKILWWYPWKNILYATPIPLLLLAIFGFTQIKGTQKVLAIWFIVPLLRAFFPHAAFYDGMRHFLEVVPAGILIAAIGISRLPKLGKIIAATLIVSQLLYINITLFPYSTGYLNILAKNQNERFDRDIEALSIKEAVDYLHKEYGAIKLWCFIGGHLSWHYLTPLDHYTYPTEADSIIIVNKASHINQGGPYIPVDPQRFDLVHTISRGDAVFAWIYRKK